MVSIEVGVIKGGEDGSFAVAESDRVAVTVAVASHDDGVAINQELTLLIGWKLDYFFATPAEFEHGTVLVLLWARDCSTSEKVTNAHVATSD